MSLQVEATTVDSVSALEELDRLMEFSEAKFYIGRENDLLVILYLRDGASLRQERILVSEADRYVNYFHIIRSHFLDVQKSIYKFHPFNCLSFNVFDTFFA